VSDERRPTTRPGPARVAEVAARAAQVTLFFAGSLVACRATPTDGFQLDLPASALSQVAWFEVGIFSGTSCASLAPRLAGGVPLDGDVQRLAFRASGAHPGIPNLPRATYAIGVAARAADCSVVATGCSDVDLSSAASVTVVLDAVSGTPAGACAGGTSCDQARCTGGASSAGGGCSLQLLGAGPFADPLAFTGTMMSAPAVAPTPNGFVVAYREYDPSVGQARVTVLPIDDNGGAASATQTSVTACVSNPISDATALFFSGSSGLVAVARAGCGADPGVDLLPIDATGAFAMPGFSDRGALPLTLSPAHALAGSASGVFLAYAQGGVATAATESASALGTPAPFGVSAASGAWVAASDQVLALVSTGSGTLPASGAGDGGADGGDDGSAGPGTDAVLGVNVIDLSLGPSPLGAIGAPLLFPGTWASVSAQAGRVFVASDGTAANPVAYRAFDVGGAAAAVDDGFAIPNFGAVSYADVAFHQDHAFFAVESNSAIELVAFQNATTTPTLLREISLASDARVPSIANVRDGRIAVVATDTRVVVAWATGQSLSANDAAGGYAVFACTTP
jgi:hypothetical protein